MSEKDPIKVYDARWEEGEFSDGEVARLFESILIYGRRLGVDTVTISRDARLGAPKVMEIGVEIALRAGFAVSLCTDPISTPMSYFMSAQSSSERPGTMGLAITASHNPGGYIGLKPTVPTVRAIGLDSGPDGGLTSVREIYHTSERLPESVQGRLHLVDPAEEYIAASTGIAGVGAGELAGVEVVLDAFNGSAGSELYRALELAGARVHPLRLVPDGRFPTGAPNPTSQGKMAEAVAEAQRIGSAIVIGVDGDGDRLVFGDHRGILDAGFASIAILAVDPAFRAPREPIPALYDPKVNPIALEAWGRFKAKPLLFRNGHSQIKDYMASSSARFGAEESGHYYHRLRYGSIEVNAENSIVTALRFLKGVQTSSGALDNLWNLQGQVYSSGEINFQFEEQSTVDLAMKDVVQLLVAEGAATVSATPDGIDLGGTQVSRGVDVGPKGITLDRGWYSGYLRSSTNERAVLRSFFSSGDEKTGRRLGTEVTRLLRETYRGRQIE
jgi:phosphomannomutase